MTHGQSDSPWKSPEGSTLEMKLLQKNFRLAKRILGSPLGSRMMSQLKTLSRDYGFSVEAGELQILDGSWYVTHTGLRSSGPSEEVPRYPRRGRRFAV